MPKVSVIIPIYNTERYLPQCLDSVVAQTLEDIEIICVDDGSTDGSDAILREYAQRDERVIVVHQENQGLSAARNAGLDVASGDFIQFLDSDDWAEPTLLEDAYTRCVDDQAEMCIVRFRYVREDTGVTLDADCSLRMNLIPEKRPFSRSDVSGGLFELSTPAAWNKMLSRSFVVDKGLRFSGGAFDIEDVPFTYMALIQAQRITVVDKVLVNYRTGVAGSLMANVHERPTAICQALLLVKAGAQRLGVFEEIERDFVSTALDQCLYHLKIAKTAEAFQTLYEALKQTYFAELGIDGLASDDHPDQLQYDRYVRIRPCPPSRISSQRRRNFASISPPGWSSTAPCESPWSSGPSSLGTCAARSRCQVSRDQGPARGSRCQVSRDQGPARGSRCQVSGVRFTRGPTQEDERRAGDRDREPREDRCEADSNRALTLV